MRVLYDKKIWSFDKELSVDELLKKLKLKKEQIIILVDGKKLEGNDNISKESSVLIVEKAYGG